MMAEVLLLCYHTPVIVESTPFTLVLGVPAVCLELVLVGMVLYRGLHRRLPIFTAYVALVVVKEAVTSLVLYRFGLRSLPYYYAYWGSQGILVVLRGLVVAELLHAVLRPHRGVWTIARFALSVTAATLLLYAAVESAASAPQIGGFVLAADRGLEFAVVGALLALLAVCRYYEVGLDPLSAAIALGLAIYSSFAIMNNTVLFRLRADVEHHAAGFLRCGRHDLALAALTARAGARSGPHPDFCERLPATGARIQRQNA